MKKLFWWMVYAIVGLVAGVVIIVGLGWLIVKAFQLANASLLFALVFFGWLFWRVVKEV